jgi:endonuclease III-like uncharacterized protein
MWDKDKMGEMDEEKKAKWVKKISDLGVPEDKIDEKLIWAFKKTSMKISHLRLKLDAIGIDEAKAKEIVEKVVNHSLEKDLAKIKEWHEQHQEK